MQTLKQYWKKELENSKDNPWWLKPNQEVIDLASGFKQGKFLDIGCGMGRHTILLAKMGFDVVAFDGAKDAVEYTKEWLKKEKLSAEVYLSDFLTWEYGENLYDGILSINSFHHAKEQEVKNTAKKIAKSLKIGGVFLQMCQI
jgi:2-polyprenyl-3-methyl-5-hydroxy-6-metoxy-1,4-benzoquinol methylase